MAEGVAAAGLSDTFRKRPERRQISGNQRLL